MYICQQSFKHLLHNLNLIMSKMSVLAHHLLEAVNFLNKMPIWTHSLGKQTLLRKEGEEKMQEGEVSGIMLSKMCFGLPCLWASHGHKEKEPTQGDKLN